MKNLGWLLIFIPALCTCSLVFMVILHYFHIIESTEILVGLMFSLLALNLMGCVTIGLKTSGNLPYLLFGNLLFFIIFVFSIATVNTHDCQHHEQKQNSQLDTPVLGQQLDLDLARE
ncbi:hypothetical protein AB4298_03695 [Shewanella sp. 10N.261.52.F9]|uniref:hypothetical protein n=1 Tax=Shewanella TaxID=22 RepID=UPI00200E5947|nr:hypothetical protein [Shewanella marinintestina]MCL1145816.1 hypothetical protein [Shewanella marinintestina]